MRLRTCSTHDAPACIVPTMQGTHAHTHTSTLCYLCEYRGVRGHSLSLYTFWDHLLSGMHLCCTVVCNAPRKLPSLVPGLGVICVTSSGAALHALLCRAPCGLVFSCGGMSVDGFIHPHYSTRQSSGTHPLQQCVPSGCLVFLLWSWCDE